jgi:quercetin dioxygenase-like cupin family protein
MNEPRANRSYYESWVEREGMDLIRGYHIENAYTLPVKPRARTGGSEVRIQLDGTGEVSDALICEIPAGGKLEPQRHLYEELTYVLAGQGSTTVWYSGQQPTSFEWQGGSAFSIPLNAWYQHFNLRGTEPARYLSITTAPVMFDLLCSEDFIFNNPATFSDRYDGREDFFSAELKTRESPGQAGVTAYTNFLANINMIPPHTSLRSLEGTGRRISMGQGRNLTAHSTTFTGRTFSTVHRHGPGFHVLWLSGEGYVVMWPDGGEKEKVKIHFGPGSIIVPPTLWWHHWGIVSPEPAQDFALHPPLQSSGVSRMGAGPTVSTRQGGSNLLVEDFPPELRKEVEDIFAEECRAYDARCAQPTSRD